MAIEELKSGDVVDRARWYATHQRPQAADSHMRFCREVAAEIERLRFDNDCLKEACDKMAAEASETRLDHNDG